MPDGAPRARVILAADEALLLNNEAVREQIDVDAAEVPPCAYNPLISCPLLPASDPIRTVVRAGQHDVLFDESA